MTQRVGTEASRYDINFTWLVRLRWAAFAAQAATVLIVDRVLGVPLATTELLAVIGVGLASNVGCAWWARRRPARPCGGGAGAGGGGAGGAVREPHLAAVMATDVLLLTALLYLSGGPFNPFSFLYLVQIALAAVVLPGRWTWALVGLSLLASASLFVDHRPLEVPAKTHDEHMRWHLEGMWVAFGVAAAFIVYFLMRVLRALAAREAELAAAQRRAARQDRLAALATLAGGAAHELATPLATIATVVRELERQLGAQPAEVHEDLELLRAEVDRCRAILDQMAANAGQAAGEEARAVPLAEVVAAAMRGLPAQPAVDVALGAAGAIERVWPLRALGQALRVLVQNAQDASPEGAAVAVRAEVDAAAGGALRVVVEDRGRGMTPEVLARAGEPFFTTKEPGRGMGLGLFLSRSVVEGLGGALELESRPGQGTRAEIVLPAPRVAPGSGAGPATSGRRAGAAA